MDRSELAKQISAAIKARIEGEVGIPVYRTSSELVSEVETWALNYPEVEKHYERNSLKREIEFYLGSPAIHFAKTPEQALERIESFVEGLRRQKSFEALVILPGIYDLPTSTRLADLEIIEIPQLKDQEREYLERLSERENVVWKDATCGRICFKSYTTLNAGALLLEKLEMPISLLAFILDIDYEPRNCIGIVTSDTNFTVYLDPIESNLLRYNFYERVAGELYTNLAEISQEKKPKQLKQSSCSLLGYTDCHA